MSNQQKTGPGLFTLRRAVPVAAAGGPTPTSTSTAARLRRCQQSHQRLPHRRGRNRGHRIVGSEILRPEHRAPADQGGELARRGRAEQGQQRHVGGKAENLADPGATGPITAELGHLGCVQHNIGRSLQLVVGLEHRGELAAQAIHQGEGAFGDLAQRGQGRADAAVQVERGFDDPLAGPALRDITAQVDFTDLAEKAVALGLTPLAYSDQQRVELAPYLSVPPAGPRLSALLASIDRASVPVVQFLVDLNQRVQREVGYLIRLEPGVQTSEETLTRGTGSCRDSAWLLVEAARHLGLAARFVSGYLIQLQADVRPLDGPAGPEHDFTDLHAWAEVYLPGAGWIGLDRRHVVIRGHR